jgi:hypothetical protein
MSKLALENIEGSQNLQIFPYDKLVDDWTGTKKVFRFYVDANNGNDNNDGLTWPTAFQSFIKLFEVLPRDLKGYQAHVYVKSGTYLFFEANISGGPVFLKWCGTTINTNIGAEFDWCRQGAINPIQDNERIILTNDYSSTRRLLFTMTSGGSINFWASSTFSSGYDVVHTRWMIDLRGDASQISFQYPIYAETQPNSGVWFQHGVYVNFGNANGYGIGVGGGGFMNFRGGWFIGGTGAPSLGSGNQCAYRIMGGGDTLFEDGSALFYDTSIITFPVITKIDKIRQIIGLSYNNGNATINLGSSANIEIVQVSPGVNPDILIQSNSPSFRGTVTYTSNKLNLIDYSVVNHTITDTYTGITKVFVTGNLKEISGNIISHFNSSSPADTLLGNSEGIFYIDEGTGKLIVKLKYSNGTVKTGEITLT